MGALAVLGCGDDRSSDSDGDVSSGVSDVGRADIDSDCRPVAFEDRSERGTCNYYSCLDEELGCGEGEYLLDFACHYADRYLEQTYGEMSEDGQAFLRSVYLCLQQSFADADDAVVDCQSAAELGFASHVPCYLAAGFCELPPGDKLRVFAAIDSEDLENPLQQAAQEEVIARCSDE